MGALLLALRWSLIEREFLSSVVAPLSDGAKPLALLYQTSASRRGGKCWAN